VIKEMDLTLADGRALHCYDSGDAGGLTVFHGGQDRMVPSEHGAWLAARCPDAELWLRPDDGHVSVLGSCGVAALDWLVAHV
jgi:pimeloyl-ACP methyl ester carboxylesterase